MYCPSGQPNELPGDTEMYPPPPETAVVSKWQFDLNVAVTVWSPFMETNVALLLLSPVPAHDSQA